MQSSVIETDAVITAAADHFSLCLFFDQFVKSACFNEFFDFVVSFRIHVDGRRDLGKAEVEASLFRCIVDRNAVSCSDDVLGGASVRCEHVTFFDGHRPDLQERIDVEDLFRAAFLAFVAGGAVPEVGVAEDTVF